ncbi:hypothetical protein [Synechococcus sp. A15-127]|uniref:hypothetical protein n=1 Tax=Synechococcus sp. A15-127 TaxID=1050624 RepID=UPI001647588F|nr:hypothetical protein [Synechococcus sp. A15-127]
MKERPTEESKKAAAGYLRDLALNGLSNGNISANEATALNCVALSILIGFSDEGIKAFATANPAKTADVFPMAVTELISTWWNDDRITDAFPFLIALRKEVNSDLNRFQYGVNWSFVLNAFIEAGTKLEEA